MLGLLVKCTFIILTKFSNWDRNSIIYESTNFLKCLGYVDIWNNNWHKYLYIYIKRSRMNVFIASATIFFIILTYLFQKKVWKYLSLSFLFVIYWYIRDYKWQRLTDTLKNAKTSNLLSANEIVFMLLKLLNVNPHDNNYVKVGNLQSEQMLSKVNLNYK